RHTRSTRDWSSDVCSSDLPFWLFFFDGRRRLFIGAADRVGHIVPTLTLLQVFLVRVVLSFDLGALVHLRLEIVIVLVSVVHICEIGRASCRERGCATVRGS